MKSNIKLILLLGLFTSLHVGVKASEDKSNYVCLNAHVQNSGKRASYEELTESNKKIQDSYLTLVHYVEQKGPMYSNTIQTRSIATGSSYRQSQEQDFDLGQMLQVAYKIIHDHDVLEGPKAQKNKKLELIALFYPKTK